MAGNVWEWTWDTCDACPTGAVTDPTGPEGGSFRVIRGGSWREDGDRGRAASRLRACSNDYGIGLGFRLARTAP